MTFGIVNSGKDKQRSFACSLTFNVKDVCIPKYTRLFRRFRAEFSFQRYLAFWPVNNMTFSVAFCPQTSVQPLVIVSEN